MYISSIKIQNFKCYKDISLKFDPHFNLLIGGNNVGKSTILEALRLWQLAFNRFLKERTNQQSASFYAIQYFSFTISDLLFLRINDFKNLFYNNETNNKKIEITVILTNGDLDVELPITFTLTTEERNLRFELCKNSDMRNKASERLLKVIGKPKGSSFKESILITYVNPIFLLPIREEYKTKGLILENLHQSRADTVIRNLINLYAPKEFQTKEKQIKLKELEKIENELSYIITGEWPTEKKPSYRFFSNFKSDTDSYIEIIAKNPLEKKVELSQLGSGTLNLLNILTILSYGDFEKYSLNVLLLDEPDSHLHSNHQKRLFDYLIKVSKDKNKQMFVITHNHELINCAQKVLYIPTNHTKKEISEITCEKYNIVYKEIAPEYHEKMLDIAKKQEIEKELKDITKPTLICEGSSDIHILKTAFCKLYNKSNFFDSKIELIDGDGASSVANKLKHDLTETIRIGLFDSDKVGLDHFNSLITKTGFTQIDINNPFLTCKNETKYSMRLPIPKHRLEQAEWFENNTCIEYIFTDETLEKMQIPLIQQKGNLYKTIENLDAQKKKIQKKVKDLDKEDFLPFEKIFNLIAEIIDYQLFEEN